MMSVTHIAGALALTGWCLGPDPLVLDALSGGVPLWWPWYHGPDSRVRLASWRNAGLADYFSCTCGMSAILMVAWQEQWIVSWADRLHQAVSEGRR